MTAEVGVRALKAQLSDYLRRVQTGASVDVALRGRVIARIVPVDASPRPGWAMAMAGAGEAQWNGGKPRGVAPAAGSAAKRLRGQPAARAVIEDRR